MDLHISNLPFKVKEEDVLALFTQFGKVEEVKLIKDHKTRLYKGYGFVKMANAEEAKEAMEVLNETVFQERKLSVSISQKKATEKPELKTTPFWKKKVKPGIKLVKFDGEKEPEKRKKKRGQGRGTKY